MDALKTHNSRIFALKARSQNLEQKSMKEKFVIRIENLSVVFKTVCMELKYFHDPNKYNLNNIHIQLFVYIHIYCLVTTLNSYYFIIIFYYYIIYIILLSYNFKQTIQKN